MNNMLQLLLNSFSKFFLSFSKTSLIKLVIKYYLMLLLLLLRAAAGTTTQTYPTNIYLFKVNNENTRKICEICSKLTIWLWKLFKVNNKDTRTTSMTSFSCLYSWLWVDFTNCSGISVVDFEQISTGWK